MAKIILVLVLVALVVGLAIAGIQKVDSGNIGVLRSGGQVDTDPKSEGLYWVIPIYQEITPMSIQVQKYEKGTESASKDLQIVSTKVAVNYHPDPSQVPWVFQKLGIFYEDRIINPAIEETVKQVTAEYNAEELIVKRPLVKAEITSSITERLAESKIVVDHISITDFDFSASFNDAIEKKVKAEQDALTAQNQVAIKQAQAKQKIAEAEGIAESKIEIARGEAEAVRLAGDAEAYKLNVIGKSLKDNPDLLTMENIQKWNGVLPYMYVGGEGESPQLLLNVATDNKGTP